MSNKKLACTIQEQMSIKNCDNLSKTRVIIIKIQIRFQPKLNKKTSFQLLFMILISLLVFWVPTESVDTIKATAELYFW